MCNDNILQNMNVNECIKSHLVSFILTMYNDPLLSRKSIQMILTNVFSLFNNYLLPNLKYKLDTQLSLSTEHTNILDQINEIFATFTNPFDEFSTEYKRLKFLENYRFYFPPESYIIGQAKIAKNVKNRIVDNVIDVTGRHILLRNTLKSILEIPGMLNEIKHLYASDVQLNDCKLTGIKDLSIWNRLNGYDTCTNMSVDVMHDVYEGVCVYVMTSILQYFIFDLKTFTLNTLNFRIRVFDYGRLESSNDRSENFFLVFKLFATDFDYHFFGYEVNKSIQMYIISYDDAVHPEQCFLFIDQYNFFVNENDQIEFVSTGNQPQTFTDSLQDATIQSFQENDIFDDDITSGNLSENKLNDSDYSEE
ncbi:hypothetical protein ALC60_07196 [Trachymyrmex zeteki]|uniref:Uncharacterized protein n=1 Tax=Mycetomoellerius zeteki TaxID=64791 RepID=A0A151X0K8_9HYME|nr:hypothetical protein ALC60_07196 [Trachymyrmex zeteki]